MESLLIGLTKLKRRSFKSDLPTLKVLAPIKNFATSNSQVSSTSTAYQVRTKVGFASQESVEIYNMVDITSCFQPGSNQR